MNKFTHKPPIARQAQKWPKKVHIVDYIRYMKNPIALLYPLIHCKFFIGGKTKAYRKQDYDKHKGKYRFGLI